MAFIGWVPTVHDTVEQNVRVSQARNESPAECADRILTALYSAGYAVLKVDKEDVK